MGLHLENEVAVVKIPTLISNNPVYDALSMGKWLSTFRKRLLLFCVTKSDMLFIVSFSETSITIYLQTQCHTQDNSNQHKRRRGKLRPYLLFNLSTSGLYEGIPSQISSVGTQRHVIYMISEETFIQVFNKNCISNVQGTAS